jgi:acetyltransferase-like isoleucine patch superfamily enzyme
MSLLLAKFYEKFTGKTAPRYLQRNSVFLLVWKLIRKTINVSIAPLVPLTSLRMFLYRRVGYKIGSRVFIGMMCYLDDSYPQLIQIEDNVTISYRVTFTAHGKRAANGWKHLPILLKSGCYIGVGAIILPGVTVGHNAVVGAGAVVTRDVPDNATVVGVPARVVSSN